MLNVIKEQKASGMAVRLIGSVDESVQFEDLLGPPTQSMEVNCKEVSRLNSIGIKSWIKYFQNFKNNGLALKLTECSLVVVDQLNLISNFSCDAIVESIYVPFICLSCKSELAGLYQIEMIKKNEFKIADLRCTKCGGKAVFDDFVEEYFEFLKR